MLRINKEEYELLKGLDDNFKWIARDSDNILWLHEKEPIKDENYWDELSGDYEIVDSDLFQFIQWEDEEPWNIQELIEHYEYWLKLAKNPTIANLVGYEDESEETEVRNRIKLLKEEFYKAVDRAMKEPMRGGGELKYIHIDCLKKIIDQLDEPEPKKIMLQDITDRLWELSLNNRKQWLERLNNEFQEGYIVPLGLKTTDGEEQYLTFNGSYFASQRKRGLKQTFATLEEIPEFYRDLAERVL